VTDESDPHGAILKFVCRPFESGYADHLAMIFTSFGAAAMTTVGGHFLAEDWIRKLNDQWDRLVDTTVAGFVQLGRDLNECKASSAHGQWQKTLAGLKFDASVARIFMRISRWVQKSSTLRIEAESNACIMAILPPDYTTIDQIARLKEPQLKRLIENGTICPSVRRNKVAEIIRLDKVKQDQERILKLQPRPGKYRTIVCDPAWDFDAFSRGAVSRMPYAKQSVEEIAKLDLKRWAEDECHLYCWCPNAYVLQAGALISGWGFEYKNILTWVKPPPFGLGKNFRNATEKCLFATIGERTTRADNIPDYFCAPRGEHSEKPEEFYEIVRAASYPPYGELHQRKLREDFTDLFMAGDIIEAAE
jgi:N6-adenosine-specific RNA methylase IME4